MSNVLEWKETQGVLGPVVHYGYWNEAKCISVYAEHNDPTKPTAKYCVKSTLPGFRQDLPKQNTVAEAKVFAERMLERWVAKRGLLFKSRIVCTDAMITAARKAANENSDDHTLSDEALCAIVKAAIEAREPHAATIANNTPQRKGMRR